MSNDNGLVDEYEKLEVQKKEWKDHIRKSGGKNKNFLEEKLRGKVPRGALTYVQIPHGHFPKNAKWPSPEGAFIF